LPVSQAVKPLREQINAIGSCVMSKFEHDLNVAYGLISLAL
jgi:hypothetical protein